MHLARIVKLSIRETHAARRYSTVLIYSHHTHTVRNAHSHKHTHTHTDITLRRRRRNGRDIINYKPGVCLHSRGLCKPSTKYEYTRKHIYIYAQSSENIQCVGYHHVYVIEERRKASRRATTRKPWNSKQLARTNTHTQPIHTYTWISTAEREQTAFQSMLASFGERRGKKIDQMIGNAWMWALRKWHSHIYMYGIYLWGVGTHASYVLLMS